MHQICDVPTHVSIQITLPSTESAETDRETFDAEELPPLLTEVDSSTYLQCCYY